MSEINHSGFMSKMVDEFYKYMGDVYIEYKLLPEKPQIPVKEVKNDNLDKATLITDISNITQDEEIPDTNLDSNSTNINIEKREQTFIEYFLFKLYFNYGIKRRMISDKIALLFYDKNLKGYKANELITMLCRHMMLDIDNMKIISLGIPKAMKIEDFLTIYNISPEDVSTNITISEDGISKIEKYRIYRFPEGTMMTYNPSLKKYNVDIASSDANVTDPSQNEQDQDENEVNHKDEIEKNISEQFKKQFEYSTRRKVGTGRFSSMKTFLEMFNENNDIANTKLENIPEDIMKDKVLVFNIEHPENRMISPLVRNYNTLCAVYQLKSNEQADKEWKNIESIQITDIDGIRSAFTSLGNNMIVQIHVASFKLQVEQYNVNLHMPEIVKSFEKKNQDGTVTMIPISDITISSLQEMVSRRPKTFQGYIIYGVNGERSKINNPQYKLLKKLKGNRPIVIEQWNTKNLFYLYWRLVKENLVMQFINEFNIPGGWSYHQLFSWFANIIRNYSFHLFKSYHHSFVKKDMDKHTIPYSMKPFCGELHKSYQQNRMPISNTMVEQFVFSQPAGKIFWRLFSGK